MKLRVLLVTTSLMRGGAETQVVLLARFLKARGHEVRVVTMRDPEAFGEELASLAIPLISLGMTAGLPELRAVVRLAREIGSWQPDIVHSHMVHANLLARLTRLFVRIPVQISTAHSFNEGARWREIAYRLTDPLCTLTTNVCQAAVDRFVHIGAVPAGKIRCVWNGIDLDALDSIGRQEGSRELLGTQDNFAWLAVGNLGLAKDYPNMLAAVKQANEKGARTTLAIVGGGSEREEQELDLARQNLGLSPEQVRFLGPRGDVARLMQAADGYLMSSAWEGLPLVLLEASAAGLPIVATAVGGNPEAVVHGVTGFLVEPGNPGALADGMQRVMSMTGSERMAIGEAGRRLVEERFRMDRIVDLWEGIYHELLGRGPDRIQDGSASRSAR